MNRFRLPLVIGLALAAALVASGPANAIYIVTPLRLEASASQVDVGDEVDFSIGPQDDRNATTWAGKTVIVRYVWDAAERDGQDADAPTSSDSMQERTLPDPVALDGKASGRFTWTVPEEVRDHNVDVILESEDGERLAFTYLAVGDAPPQMRILAGSGPGPTEPGPGDETQGAPRTGEGNPPPDTNSVPALGAAGLVGVAVAAAALAVVARRR